MKKMTKVLVMVVAFIAIAFNAAGQSASANATATATIVTPISITKNVDMNFGNVAAGAGAGTVVLSPLGVRTPTGVTLPSVTGTVAAAQFDIAGLANANFAITVPAVAVTLTSGANTMTADNFTSSLGATNTLSGAGTASLTVGATLNVGAGQAPGTYVSGNFAVTVNYN